jgi:hypothetical protein
MRPIGSTQSSIISSRSAISLRPETLACIQENANLLLPTKPTPKKLCG